MGFLRSLSEILSYGGGIGGVGGVNSPADLFYQIVDITEERYDMYRTIYDIMKNTTFNDTTFNSAYKSLTTIDNYWINKYYEKRLLLSQFDLKRFDWGGQQYFTKINNYFILEPYAINLYSGYVYYETCLIINDLVNDDKFIVYSLVSDIGNYKMFVAYEVAYAILRLASNPEQVLALSLLSFPVYRNQIQDDLDPIFGNKTKDIMNLMRKREDIASIIKHALAIINEAGISLLEWEDLLDFYAKNNISLGLLEVKEGLDKIMRKVKSNSILAPYIDEINYRGSGTSWILHDVGSGLVQENRFTWKFNGKSLDYSVNSRVNHIGQYIVNLRPYKARLVVGDIGNKTIFVKAVNCSNRQSLERISSNIEGSLRNKKMLRRVYDIITRDDVWDINLSELLKFSEVQIKFNFIQRRGSMSTLYIE